MYKRLDVGSAKVDEGVCSRVSHHLLNVSSVREQFNAGDFYRLAEQAIQVSSSLLHFCATLQSPWAFTPSQEVISRGRVPLVVGGTGLYLHTLMHGPTGAPPSTSETRAGVDRMVEGEMWEAR